PARQAFPRAGTLPVSILIDAGGRQEVAAPLANGSIIMSVGGLYPNAGEWQDSFRRSLRQLRELGSISAPRWRMSPMFGLLVAWGILTGILIVLLIYRSTLTMHEDDSIFLHETESQMHKDQTEVIAKMRR